MEDLEEAAVMAVEWGLDFEGRLRDGPMWEEGVEDCLGAMPMAGMGIPRWRMGREDFLPESIRDPGGWTLTASPTPPNRSCNF